MSSTTVKETLDQCQRGSRVVEYVLENGLRNFKHSAVDLVSGGIGAAVSVYVGQPLDTIKVKLQTFPKMYSCMTQCFANTFRKEGIRGLYAGTLPALAANVAENSILFAAYGICQKGVAIVQHVEKVEQLTPVQNAWSGFFAAFFSSLALCPTELVKCRLQAMHELNLTQNGAVQDKITPFNLVKKIFREEGTPGFFRGLTSTLTREMPGYFVFFGTYELSRHFLTPVGKTKDDIGAINTVISGGFAGTALWISIFPADVAKSRIQVSGSRTPMLTVIYHIVKHEGVLSLYRGLTPTIIRSFPATGALFFAYEWSKKCLHSLSSDS